MKKILKILFCLLLAQGVKAQPSLKIEKGVVFQLTGDTFLLDSLQMRDSSVLLLDLRHRSCLIRANYFSAGNGVRIFGIGRDGKQGSDGADAIARALDLPGKDGSSGTPGVNLTLHISNLVIQSLLEINLYGGLGGNGGQGGSIVQHSTTSVAERPNVGHGGNGGDGGNGGNVIIGCPADLENIVKDKIIINARGGVGGKSGTPKELRNPGWYYQYEKNGVTGRDGEIKFIYFRREHE